MVSEGITPSDSRSSEDHAATGLSGEYIFLFIWYMIGDKVFIR